MSKLPKSTKKPPKDIDLSEFESREFSEAVEKQVKDKVAVVLETNITFGGCAECPLEKCASRNTTDSDCRLVRERIKSFTEALSYNPRVNGDSYLGLKPIISLLGAITIAEEYFREYGPHHVNPLSGAMEFSPMFKYYIKILGMLHDQMSAFGLNPRGQVLLNNQLLDEAGKVAYLRDYVETHYGVLRPKKSDQHHRVYEGQATSKPAT